MELSALISRSCVSVVSTGVRKRLSVFDWDFGCRSNWIKPLTCPIVKFYLAFSLLLEALFRFELLLLGLLSFVQAQ